MQRLLGSSPSKTIPENVVEEFLRHVTACHGNRDVLSPIAHILLVACGMVVFVFLRSACKMIRSLQHSLLCQMNRHELGACFVLVTVLPTVSGKLTIVQCMTVGT